jgi:hypothetical protein
VKRTLLPTILSRGGCFSVSLLLALILGSAASAVTPSASPNHVHTLVAATPVFTPSQVRQAVSAGVLLTKVPADLHPDLHHASNDSERIHSDDCPKAKKMQDATFGECVYGDAGAKRELVLFGDSHAGMWFDGIKAAATAARWRFRIFYNSGCPVPTLKLSDTPYRTDKECAKWRASAIAAIRESRPTMVVVTSASFEQHVAEHTFASESQWAAGLETTLRELKAPHRTVIILGDIPLLRQSAPECLAAHESNVQACATPKADALKGVLIRAEQTAAQATGARRIDVSPWFCTSVCPPIVHHILVYRERFHISATYSIFLSGVLRAALKL